MCAVCSRVTARAPTVDPIKIVIKKIPAFYYLMIINNDYKPLNRTRCVLCETLLTILFFLTILIGSTVGALAVTPDPYTGGPCCAGGRGVHLCGVLRKSGAQARPGIGRG